MNSLINNAKTNVRVVLTRDKFVCITYNRLVVKCVEMWSVIMYQYNTREFDEFKCILIVNTSRFLYDNSLSISEFTTKTVTFLFWNECVIHFVLHLKFTLYFWHSFWLTLNSHEKLFTNDKTAHQSTISCQIYC